MRRAHPAPVFDDAHDERRQREEAKAQAREEVRQQVRQAFPQVTKFADEMRNVFPSARLVWAVEGKFAVGKVPPEVRQQQEAAFGPLTEIGRNG